MSERAGDQELISGTVREEGGSGTIKRYRSFLYNTNIGNSRKEG